MDELVNWIDALLADGCVFTEVRVSEPWASHLVSTGTVPAGLLSSPHTGEEERAVALTSTGERFDAILCA